DEAGACAAVYTRVFTEGGAGGVDLAQAVIDATSGDEPNIKYMYSEDATIREKVLALAQKMYGANDVSWAPSTRRLLRRYEEQGWGSLPVCMAKTHLSISHNPRLKGRPSGYTFQVNDVRASVGAGFIYPIAGSIMTMPGLPGSPRALDVDGEGNILGL
ncbi:MAG: formate--tetrahydrofolate ligase, partial [Chloroflexi bacterium]|nr:formate--tetrahydrofolate ligase [Chloroflexota bacterium]